MAISTWGSQPKMAKIEFSEVPYKLLCAVTGFTKTKTGTYAVFGSLENATSTAQDGLLLVKGVLYTQYEQIPPIIQVGYHKNPKTGDNVMRQQLWVPIYDYEQYVTTLGIQLDGTSPIVQYQTLVAKLKNVVTCIQGAQTVK